MSSNLIQQLQSVRSILKPFNKSSYWIANYKRLKLR